MADGSIIEQLTPLDLLMPRLYIRGCLIFETAGSTSKILQNLQNGLEAVVRQFPFLSGSVYPTMSTDSKPGLHIRATDTTPTLTDKGTIAAFYTTLSAKRMPQTAIPEEVWPVSGIIDDELFTTGTPVFVSSMFRFADGQGLGLCICVHHNVVDATGFSEIVKLWSQNVTSPGSISCKPYMDRLTRLREALNPGITMVSSESTDDPFSIHPEYSKSPPVFPGECPSCTSKMFAIPIERITEIKDLLRQYISTEPTTNTLICALLWSSVTRARMQRNPDLVNKLSRLTTAVNGRNRINETFSTPENPYFGNVILYSLATLSVEDLGLGCQNDQLQLLAKICNAISDAQSSNKIDHRHVAEVYSLVDNMEDYKTLFPGWDLFNSRDLMITSWADIDFYGMDFGPGLGKPSFFRIPYSEADGVGLVLPRKRGTVDEAIEVILMLRKDDMEALERHDTWGIFRNEVRD